MPSSTKQGWKVPRVEKYILVPKAARPCDRGRQLLGFGQVAVLLEQLLGLPRGHWPALVSASAVKTSRAGRSAVRHAGVGRPRFTIRALGRQSRKYALI